MLRSMVWGSGRVPPHLSRVGPFGRNNIAASQTNILMGIDGVVGAAGFDGLAVAARARVHGISYVFAGGSTTGTITITVFKNGADPGTAYDVPVANSAAIVHGAHRFATPLDLAAGDYVGVAVSSTADWNGAAGDLQVEVLLEEDAS